MSRLTRGLAALGLSLALGACASDPEPGSLVGAEGGAGAAGGFGAGGVQGGALGQPAPDTPAYFEQVVGDRVFFALDSSALDPQAEETLSRQARWLQQNPAPEVVIEGHADERGTREYNLALGARRAAAARDFLLAEGVEPTRLRTVSYGKERPVALCSNESCWSQNRRAVTTLVGGPTS